jgi:hypothetical protein
MVANPGATAITSPFGFTLTTFGFEDVQLPPMSPFDVIVVDPP